MELRDKSDFWIQKFKTNVKISYEAAEFKEGKNKILKKIHLKDHSAINVKDKIGHKKKFFKKDRQILEYSKFFILRGSKVCSEVKNIFTIHQIRKNLFMSTEENEKFKRIT